MATLGNASVSSASSSDGAMTATAASTAASLSASGSDNDAAGTSVETPTPTSLAQDSKASDDLCMWTQQSSDACDSPRSCYDCLNTSPGDGIQCVITSDGYCTTMDAYVYTEDWRLNASDSAPHYFPSVNTTYCEDDDATCTACAADQFIKSAGGNTDPSQYCVGDGGCVCVGFCESPIYTSLVTSDMCTTAGSDTSVSVMGVSVTDIIVIVVLCFTVPVFIYLWWARRTRLRRLQREEAHRNRPPVNGPLLELAGWKKHREDQMASEQQAIADLATSSDGGQANAVESIVPATGGDDGAQLSNLQIAALSVEFEDPEHPMTAVTSTGRRRSSLGGWLPGANSGERQESPAEEPGDVRATPYTELDDSATQEIPTRR